MKSFRCTFFFCIFAVAAISGGHAFAQRYVEDCAHAKTAADIMTCVKKRSDTAQKELNDLYIKAIENQAPDSPISLGETQQGWFVYRDAQCAWEAAQADTGHEKIYELSCIAALTEDRIKVLRAMNDLATSDRPREFSSHPRWMNALADDYPDVLWRYNQWVQADLDCDGEEEEIMTGVAMKYDVNGRPFFRTLDEESLKNGLFAGPLYKAEAVIALSDNPRTGLSKITLFRLPVGARDNSMFFCDMPESLSVVHETMGPDDETQNDSNGDDRTAQSSNSASCQTRLKVTDGQCNPAYVYWDGHQYQVEKKSN